MAKTLDCTVPPSSGVDQKHLCAIFNDHGLKITIEANKKCVDFFDVTLNLTTGKYMPYTKPNCTPLYIHTQSNHPPVIIKNLPESINKRLSDISSDKESFDRAATPYQRALEYSGYNYKLKFQPSTSPSNTRQKQKRQRNITWYNPPYSKNVATNIAKTFLQILDEEFPKNHVLHKIFNRNTVKISYACMPNIKQTIDGHNKSILLKSDKPKNDECNCRKPDECPLLIKDNNVEFDIKWKILKQAKCYNNISNRCNLCLWEKYFIICIHSMASLTNAMNLYRHADMLINS